MGVILGFWRALALLCFLFQWVYLFPCQAQPWAEQTLVLLLPLDPLIPEFSGSGSTSPLSSPAQRGTPADTFLLALGGSESPRIAWIVRPFCSYVQGAPLRRSHLSLS